MTLVELDAADAPLLEALARLSHAAAATHAPRWLPTLDDAREEVADATRPGRVARVLLGADARPLAWGSIFHVYGHVWEVHPLLVDPAHHRRGYGARVLAELEARAAARGAGVLIVGTSDETGATSLSGRDLYADPVAAMASMTFEPSHAVGFWLRMGYALVGVTPDAEGPGRPSINLAKRPPRA
ncbi:MAG: GNAT family N-acetyltransferase [Myxococcales bacterium]|nr:GNAT family N-acetyltransferase [Myxococcales bacterium]